MTCLVSLLSEQLLPNYLVAKEMEGRYEQHVFITTRRMGNDGMTARLCNALKINKKDVRLVVVSEEDLPDARRKLNECGFSRDDRYLVNLTGGTKIMSLAAFQHFFKYEAQFYYLPVGVNKIEDVRTGADLPINYRVNVAEYLTLQGLSIEASETHYQSGDNKGEQFEKYIYNRIKSECGLKDDFIARGVKLFHDSKAQNIDNEIVVVWTSNNKLFVGECKVSLKKPVAMDGIRPINSQPEYLDEIMYKLAAITKDLGKGVNPYIFIKQGLSPRSFNDARLASIKRRMKILGINGLIGAEELRQKQLPLT